MRVYVNKIMMGRENYPKLIKQFPKIEFVDEVDECSDVEVLVCMPQFLREHDIFNLKNLKWIQFLMAGYDTVNLAKIKEKGIQFSNASDVFSMSIAEDVFTKILFFNRNIKHYLNSMKEKKWEPIRREPELTNSVVGILGVGSIGKEIAKRMIPFGIDKIIGYRNQNKPEQYFDEIYTGKNGLKKLIEQSDYLIVALPLTDETYQIINRETLSFMKKNALFINVGRGKLVNQDDLIEALKNKAIRGAALDVTDPEPLPQDNPLWALDNVFITPHNASSSPFMQDRLYELTVENLQRYISGKSVKYLL
jgi:D-2-hydroxyacid dehydrogenase (NADP+)